MLCFVNRQHPLITEDVTSEGKAAQWFYIISLQLLTEQSTVDPLQSGNTGAIMYLHVCLTEKIMSTAQRWVVLCHFP